MTTEVRVSTPIKRAKSSISAKSDKPKGADKPSSKQTAAETVHAGNEPQAASVTKHDRLLALLSGRRRRHRHRNDGSFRLAAA